MAKRPCIKCGTPFLGQCVDLPKRFPGRLMRSDADPDEVAAALATEHPPLRT